MNMVQGTSYESPTIIASLDALGMIADADGTAVGTVCSSHCEVHEAPNAVEPRER
jgi:hypothetical protein